MVGIAVLTMVPLRAERKRHSWMARDIEVEFFH